MFIQSQEIQENVIPSLFTNLKLSIYIFCILFSPLGNQKIFHEYINSLCTTQLFVIRSNSRLFEETNCTTNHVCLLVTVNVTTYGQEELSLEGSFPIFFFFFLAHDSIQTPYHGTGMKTLDRDDFKIIWAKVKCFYSKHNVEYIDDQEE